MGQEPRHGRRDQLRSQGSVIRSSLSTGGSIVWRTDTMRPREGIGERRLAVLVRITVTWTAHHSARSFHFPLRSSTAQAGPAI
jgi:hypothetical protein